MLEEYLKKTEPEYYPPVENLLDLIYEHYTENNPVEKNPVEYSNAIVHAFQRFRAPFSGKIVHIFPEQRGVSQSLCKPPN